MRPEALFPLFAEATSLPGIGDADAGNYEWAIFYQVRKED